jgi:hypothetical protein
LIEKYRSALISKLAAYLSDNKNSLWSIACSSHGLAYLDSLYDSAKEKVPEGKGLTVRNAIERFVLSNERITSFDLNPWPSNKACAY